MFNTKIEIEKGGPGRREIESEIDREFETRGPALSPDSASVFESVSVSTRHRHHIHNRCVKTYPKRTRTVTGQRRRPFAHVQGLGAPMPALLLAQAHPDAARGPG